MIFSLNYEQSIHLPYLKLKDFVQLELRNMLQLEICTKLLPSWFSPVLIQIFYDQLVSLHPQATTYLNVHQNIMDRVLAEPSIIWDKLIPLGYRCFASGCSYCCSLTNACPAAPLRTHVHWLREHWQYLLTDDLKKASHGKRPDSQR